MQNYYLHSNVFSSPSDATSSFQSRQWFRKLSYYWVLWASLSSKQSSVFFIRDPRCSATRDFV